MVDQSRKDEVLKSLLEVAASKWSETQVADMWSAFETAAKVIVKVDEFHLEPDVEPAHFPTISKQARKKDLEV